ncbi:MAG: hypothetical protein CMO55_08440 [Verrucomicrobiales bacterium]|nr:hypothetical protein [Verrucomicrobiales bacterium]
MSSFHIRPRFDQEVSGTPEDVQDRIITFIEPNQEQFELKRFPDFLCIRIAEQDRHFWSPRLNLSLESTEDGKTHIHGIYGPNANAWSLFLFSYIILGFLGLIAAMVAVAQCIIGQPATWFWAVGAAVGGIVILYVVAQFGQKLAAQQTFLIHQTYESAIGNSVVLH